MSDSLVVIAIDIGTSYSSGFFSFKYEPKVIKPIIEFPYEKVPTTVLFDKRKDFHSFGYEAVDHYKQLSDEEKRYWYYFKDFHKISNEHKPTELEVTECSGKRLETYKVYWSIIKYFTDPMFTKLRRLMRGDWKITDMHVVLTVPPVFSRSNKSMLQKAFLYAGFNKNYSLVNEPEAILSYWEQMWSDEQSLPKKVDLNNENGFLLVNLKGSTALISANSTKDGILRRLAYVTGGGWGGQAVHEELKQFIIKIVGAPVFLRYIEDEVGLFDFERYVESAFKRFDKNDKINFRLSLNDLCEQEYSVDLKTAIEESPFSHGVRVASRSDMIYIEPNVLNGFFKKTLEAIVSNIKNILSDKSAKEIKVIVMVGYFSRIQLVQDAVKSAFPDCQVLVPSDPEFTLVKGAILNGHYRNGKIPSAHPKVRSTVSQHTICAVVQHINDERECPEHVKEKKKVLIKKGTHVQEEDKQKYNFTMDDICDMEHIDIFIFASPKAETCESASLNNDGVKIIRKERMNFNGAHTMNINISLVFVPCGVEWIISDEGGIVAIGIENLDE